MEKFIIMEEKVDIKTLWKIVYTINLVLIVFLTFDWKNILGTYFFNYACITFVFKILALVVYLKLCITQGRRFGHAQ